MQGWCFDIEADNLYLKSSKIWYIKLKTFDGSRSLQVFPFRVGNAKAKSMLEDWIDSFEDEAS